MQHWLSFDWVAALDPDRAGRAARTVQLNGHGSSRLGGPSTNNTIVLTRSRSCGSGSGSGSDQSNARTRIQTSQKNMTNRTRPRPRYGAFTLPVFRDAGITELSRKMAFVIHTKYQYRGKSHNLRSNVVWILRFLIRSLSHNLRVLTPNHNVDTLRCCHSTDVRT